MITQIKMQQTSNGHVANDDDNFISMLSLAHEMRIFDHEALAMLTYLTECYDKNQALKNNGYLSLISPQYFDFGVAVMMAIVNALTADIFTDHGENCLSKPENEVILKCNLPKLQEKLLEMMKS